MIEAIDGEQSALGVSEGERQVGVLKVSLRDAGHLPLEIMVPLGLRKGDFYLEMHLDGPVERDNPYDVLSVFHDTFSQVAKYPCSRCPRYVIGISHQALIQSTGFYGFKSLPVDANSLTKDQINRIVDGYQKTKRFRMGKKMGPIMACYLSYDDLMARYNGHKEI